MRQEIVGVFEFGYEYCELVLIEGYDSYFYAMPEHGHVPRIKIAADHLKWVEILQSFFHESSELAMMRLGCRYLPNNNLAKSSGAYTFFMTHEQFCDVAAYVADLMVDALPALEKAWKKWHEKPKKQHKVKKKKG